MPRTVVKELLAEIQLTHVWEYGKENKMKNIESVYVVQKTNVHYNMHVNEILLASIARQ